MAERLTTWTSVLSPGDGDKRHGSNGYTNLGCRCEICRSANSAHNKRRRAQRAELIASDPSLATHGRSNTYLNWGCRCPECRAANTAKRTRWLSDRPNP